MEKSEIAVRCCLVAVTLILVPLNVYSVFGGDLGQLLMRHSGTWVMRTALSMVTLAVVGILVCWWVFYRHWRKSVSGNFAARWFWPLVLLSVPYGLLLYYFFAYRNSGNRVPTNAI